MKRLSNGQDSTLRNWRDLTAKFFGQDSPALAFIDQKIIESPNGDHAEILADERQFLNVLIQLHRPEA
jgi:hypothetical protein